MAGNKRDHEHDHGFWDGGSTGHDRDNQSGGRRSGFPGLRGGARVGVNTDLDEPRRSGIEPEQLNEEDGGR